MLNRLTQYADIEMVDGGYMVDNNPELIYSSFTAAIECAGRVYKAAHPPQHKNFQCIQQPSLIQYENLSGQTVTIQKPAATLNLDTYDLFDVMEQGVNSLADQEEFLVLQDLRRIINQRLLAFEIVERKEVASSKQVKPALYLAEDSTHASGRFQFPQEDEE